MLATPQSLLQFPGLPASCGVGPSQERKHADTRHVRCSKGASLGPRGLPVIQSRGRHGWS